MERIIQIHREIEEALSSSVQISHSEVCRLVVIDLIAKRKSVLERKEKDEWLQSFDKILRYYITEDEFQKYVINEEPTK